MVESTYLLRHNDNIDEVNLVRFVIGLNLGECGHLLRLNSIKLNYKALRNFMVDL